MARHLKTWAKDYILTRNGKRDLRKLSKREQEVLVAVLSGKEFGEVVCVSRSRGRTGNKDLPSCPPVSRSRVIGIYYEAIEKLWELSRSDGGSKE